MNLKTILHIVIGTVGYGVWAWMAFTDRTLMPDFLKFNMAMAVGTIGLALRDMPSALSAQATATPMAQSNPQAGLAVPVLLGLLATGMVLALCAVDPRPTPEPVLALWCDRTQSGNPC